MHERRPLVVGAALGVAALGVALELGQLVSGWRDFEIGDMIADAAGVCAGVAARISTRKMEIVRAVFRLNEIDRPSDS